MELAAQRGTVRVYLQGLSGRVIGGWVFAEAAPGHPCRVTGYPDDQSDTGTPQQNFILEARDGEAQGISYRVYRRE